MSTVAPAAESARCQTPWIQICSSDTLTMRLRSEIRTADLNVTTFRKAIIPLVRSGLASRAYAGTCYIVLHVGHICGLQSAVLADPCDAVTDPGKMPAHVLTQHKSTVLAAKKLMSMLSDSLRVRLTHTQPGKFALVVLSNSLCC